MKYTVKIASNLYDLSGRDSFYLSLYDVPNRHLSMLQFLANEGVFAISYEATESNDEKQAVSIKEGPVRILTWDEIKEVVNSKDYIVYLEVNYTDHEILPCIALECEESTATFNDGLGCAWELEKPTMLAEWRCWNKYPSDDDLAKVSPIEKGPH